MKQKNRQAKEKYDVFLSYRRDGGMEMAMLLKDALTKKGYSVFLDIEGLRSGPFNEKLYEIIDGCTDFVIILPPNALDRCSDEQDWVRLEIERANKGKKNIIPIMLKGFSFPEPETLPQSIRFIRLQTAPAFMNELFDDSVKKLTTFLWSSPSPRPWKRVLLSAVGVILILTAGIAIKQVMDHRSEQPSVTSETISLTIIDDNSKSATGTDRDDYSNEVQQQENLVPGAIDSSEKSNETPDSEMEPDSGESERIDLKKGQLLAFGSYEQDGKQSNGKEDIQWIVLDVHEDVALLISRKILDCQPYNQKWADITWEECTLRAWLNREFLEEAFSGEEQKALIATIVDNSREQGNSAWNKNGGFDTEDLVFLLSYEEATQYVETDDMKICNPTDYAAQRGVWKDKNNACHWWLRSPGQTQNYAAYASAQGTLSSTRDDSSNIGVRPVIWVKTEQLT